MKLTFYLFFSFHSIGKKIKYVIGMRENHLEAISLVEVVYKLYLDVLKTELSKLGILDINNMQAMIMYHIGDRKLSIGEVIDKGCFIGSNVSYNVKKLTSAGYLKQEPSQFDRRSVYLTLTKQGKEVYTKLHKAIQEQKKVLLKYGLSDQDFENLKETLTKLEYVLIRMV
ncbi:MAG: winged helix DNA-binding protein [Alphaproteobacteria bacterium]|nr:MAG: winged helix DNA-binding protein [Alphaproteobacteria bacterium]